MMWLLQFQIRFFLDIEIHCDYLIIRMVEKLVLNLKRLISNLTQVHLLRGYRIFWN